MVCEMPWIQRYEAQNNYIFETGRTHLLRPFLFVETTFMEVSMLIFSLDAIMEQKFIAIILYEASSGHETFKPMYEESIVEVLASSTDDAKEKAFALAKKREVSYENAYGHKISWKLKSIIDVSEVLETHPEKDTRELYSRHFYNIEAYKDFEELAN